MGGPLGVAMIVVRRQTGDRDSVFERVLLEVLQGLEVLEVGLSPFVLRSGGLP
jgi:hypothetical protein